MVVDKPAGESLGGIEAAPTGSQWYLQIELGWSLVRPRTAGRSGNRPAPCEFIAIPPSLPPGEPPCLEQKRSQIRSLSLSAIGWLIIRGAYSLLSIFIESFVLFYFGLSQPGFNRRRPIQPPLPMSVPCSSVY